MLINLLNTIGKSSIELFWIPIIIWTVLALIFRIILNFKFNQAFKLQYIGRIILLLTIPLTILFIILNKYILQNISSDGIATNGFMTINLPEVMVLSSATPETIQIGLYTILGIFTFITFSISIIATTRLLISAYQLKKYYKGLSVTPLTEINALNAHTKNLLNSINKTVYVTYSDSTLSPFTFGWKKPICVLPEGAKSYSASKVNMIISHELRHIKNNDYITNIVTLFLTKVFWFHPLIIRLYNEFEDYRELLCDQYVVKDSTLSKKEYASLLFELATDQPVIDNYLMMMATKPSKLKLRIMKLNNTKTNNKYFRMKTTLLILMSVSIIGITACTDINESSADTPPSPPSLNEATPPTPPAPSADSNAEFDDDVFVVVEQMPELKGGLAELVSKIKYPQEAVNEGIEGRVTVQFVVDENGDVINPTIVKGIGGGCDEEALRVVKEAKFTPGVQRGRAVKVKYSLPVVFKLG